MVPPLIKTLTRSLPSLARLRASTPNVQRPTPKEPRPGANSLETPPTANPTWLGVGSWWLGVPSEPPCDRHLLVGVEIERVAAVDLEVAEEAVAGATKGEVG